MKVVSLSATYPYPSSLISSITTVQRRHRHSLPAAIQPQNYPLEEHYQRKAKKYWVGFYKRHKNKFFKDRHYLEKDWGNYFSDDSCCPNGNPKVVLESHSEFREERVNAFVCNVVNDDLSRNVNPSSVDVVTLIFMLSAVSPKKMPLILQNIKAVLKPDGYILVRDYAIGDFAQVKLLDRNQMIGDSFYVRGDGTCSFYFSEDFLSTLFLEAGFSTVDINIHLKQIKNHSRDITMNRRWIRAIFNNVNKHLSLSCSNSRS